LENILTETSSSKGAKLSQIIQLPVSPSTALRIVRSIPLPVFGDIKTLGVDDWAYRRGQTYGTILIDMDAGKVVDILPGRDGKELKVWLRTHPEIKYVCRDRSSAYSSAVKEILPSAHQVADRFHLVKNLSDSVYEVLRSEQASAIKPKNADPLPVNPESETPSEPSEQKVQERIKGESSEYRKEIFYKVKELLGKGVSFQAVAKCLQISRATVRKYADMDSPLIKSIPLRNDYHNYMDTIEIELSKGKSILSIHQKIEKMGFKGCYAAFQKQFRNHPEYINSAKSKLSEKVACSAAKMLSPRKITLYLSFTDLEDIKSENDRTQIKQLIESNSLIRALRKQMLSFRNILSEGTPALLDKWMEETLQLGKKKLNTLVNGLKMDIDAVHNAITTSLSSGMVEGNVNRLKNIKRQMYGRADFDLLKRKVILSKTG